jgi:hypothetical protein
MRIWFWDANRPLERARCVFLNRFLTDLPLGIIGFRKVLGPGPSRADGILLASGWIPTFPNAEVDGKRPTC